MRTVSGCASEMLTRTKCFQDDSLNVPSQRKPLTGRLTIRVHAVADVDHAATGRFSRGPETFVMIKVEDIFKGRTKATRNERWPDEMHEFDIDKANEIELTVYDRTGDNSMPVGMVWIRISDIVEEMRRKKIETEFNSSGWVSADKMQDGGVRPDIQFQPPPTSNYQSGNARQGNPNAMQGPQPTGPIPIQAWFALEPVGRIQLTLSFSKSLSVNILMTQLLMLRSQAKPQQAALRPPPWTSRCNPPEERGSPRTVWPQVRPAAVLQHHALRTLWRLPQVCCWHAMHRL
jgi:hypothetical protein